MFKHYVMPFVSILFQHSSKVISQMMKKNSFFPSTPSRSRYERSNQNSYYMYSIPFFKMGTQVVHQSGKGITEFSVAEHLSTLKETVSQAADLAKLSTLISKFSPERQRALRRATSGILSWLTSTPLERYHFDLSPNEFKDGLAIRYLRHPADLSACCDGCGADFTLQQGMDCKKGGLVIQRHNEKGLFGRLFIISVAICDKGTNCKGGRSLIKRSGFKA